MHIHIILPARRPLQMLRAIRAYIGSSSGKHQLSIGVAIDDDDVASRAVLGMRPSDRVFEASAMFGGSARVVVIADAANGKVAAYNNAIRIHTVLGDRPDIIVYGSDDLIPIKSDWDDAIAQTFTAVWPGLDGALFMPVQQPSLLMTMPIVGVNCLPWLGYAYEPEYRSEWCDNELHEVLARRGRLAYAPLQLFRHEHPALGDAERMDGLHAKNSAEAVGDKAVFLRRQARGFDWPPVKLSLLIPTLPYRKPQMLALMRQIAEQLEVLPLHRARTVETMVMQTRGDEPTGTVRNFLLKNANGEYVAFIDDDDALTSGYVKSLLDALDADPKPDAVGFEVQHMLNGEPALLYRMSREFEVADGTGRPINHLAAVRRELALKAGFPDVTLAEDKAYSERLLPMLGHCGMVGETLYIYRDSRHKPTAREGWTALPRAAVVSPELMISAAQPPGMVSGV